MKSYIYAAWEKILPPNIYSSPFLDIVCSIIHLLRATICIGYCVQKWLWQEMLLKDLKSRSSTVQLAIWVDNRLRLPENVKSISNFSHCKCILSLKVLYNEN
jgi:hypothetical protein